MRKKEIEVDVDVDVGRVEWCFLAMAVAEKGMAELEYCGVVIGTSIICCPQSLTSSGLKVLKTSERRSRIGWVYILFLWSKY